MEYLAYVFVVIALYGAWLNSNLRILQSYKVWIISNAFLMFYNFYINSYAQGILFLVYFVTSINGYIKCRRQSKTLDRELISFE